MPDEKEVDGFADVQKPQGKREDPHDAIPGSPDPGRDPHAPKPLSPEDYARLEKEARQEDEEEEEARK